MIGGDVQNPSARQTGRKGVQMLRIWGKIMRNGKILEDTVIENTDSGRDPAARIEDCLMEICRRFDLARPIWLQTHTRDMERYGKTSFHQDHFVEPIRFTSLDIEIIETDEPAQP